MSIESYARILHNLASQKFCRAYRPSICNGVSDCSLHAGKAATQAGFQQPGCDLFWDCPRYIQQGLTLHAWPLAMSWHSCKT